MLAKIGKGILNVTTHCATAFFGCAIGVCLATYACALHPEPVADWVRKNSDSDKWSNSSND